ncbi:DNA polymerase III subunit alpha [Anaplasmataceae bacterium AB001_6]|nr:DNA polymerase III subunit alpha [Anaplasmataceae bacterium AB001_6]
MFVHLNVHSDFSFLKGGMKVSEIIKLCKEQNTPAIALTDSNNMCGMMEFVDCAIKNGIQPIIGYEMSILYQKNIQFNINLMVKNEIGYKNLLYYTRRFFCKPVPFHLLNNLEGLICLTGDLFYNSLIDCFDYKPILDRLSNIFAEDLFIEISRIGRNKESLAENIIFECADEFNVPIVATNNVLFENIKCVVANQALYCIANNSYLVEKDKYPYTENCYFKTPDEMQELFADIPEAVENTLYIAKKCRFLITKKPVTLPIFFKQSEDQELRLQSIAGVKKRLDIEILPEEYEKRINYELDVINGMNYAGYFLIVSDFIKWSKNNGIPVGPGRGSGVGSLVAWGLQITDLDPIKYGLIFERFLNPDRISMPDFDIDFCQEKRFKVIEYVKKKYGNVAHIITFGTFQPRAALRDVGRVLQIPYPEVDKICRIVPNNPANPINLEQAINLDERLKNLAENGDKMIRDLFEISRRIEGLYRHASVHAAGIVISDKELTDFVPIYDDEKSTIPVTQYSMKFVEMCGLIKFDFLGLKTLTIIDKISEIIRETDPDFDISRIPLDDQQTYDFLSTGKSVGIFQLESKFMQETLANLKPDGLEDIIALISLNRPGPMENIPMYIRRKHKSEKVDYYHPLLESVLQETFGVIIYQEQVMEIARVMSGYSFAEADILRRAMGKKRKEEMDMQREKFIAGAEKNKIERKKAEDIFDLVAKFAGYGFNKSHAAAYGLIAYQTAYLKAHYPKEFFIISMNIDMDDTDKIASFCYDAISMGIEILKPDINLSSVLFSIEGESIRYGLAILKNIGKTIAEDIKSCAKYDNLKDFAMAVAHKSINKKVLESLIKTGCLDCFGYNRATMLNAIDHIIHYQSAGCDVGKQMSLFDVHSDNNNDLNIDIIEDLSKDDLLFYQYQFFGFYIFGHPIEKYENRIPLYDSSCVLCIINKIIFRSRDAERIALLFCSAPNRNFVCSVYGNNRIKKYYDMLQNGKKLIIRFRNNDSSIEYMQDLDEYLDSLYEDMISIKVCSTTACEELLKLLCEKKCNDAEKLPKGKQIVLFFEKEEGLMESLLPDRYNVKISDLLGTEDLYFLNV